MIYLNLFLQFFHIGLFSFGGGYATLPFLYHMAETQKWFTTQQLTDMIAVSSITPGPVGVNVATYAGFTTSGILGALIATTAVVIPSFVIILIISKILEQFKSNKHVQAAIYALKPAGCGLLAAVGIDMFANNINTPGMAFLLLLFFVSKHKKHDPLFYLGVSAIFGILAGFLHLTT
ncbi:MAG: chromate transporter [Cyanobacteria bacterium SIG32]|nr:chromate transporter [Cyanobacteria bacterium SIG32]